MSTGSATAAGGSNHGLPAVDEISARRLAAVVPALRRRMLQVMEACYVLGHPLRVTAGRRTLAEQQALYAQGRTAPGPRVTQADGVRTRSRHQDGRAVDVVWMTPTGVSWTGPWALYGAACEAVGLTWGGRWTAPVDRPHCEWHGPEDA